MASLENLAVLIDFENIAAGTEKEGLGRFDVDALMTRVKDRGRILVSRSYADWGRFARFKQHLLNANINMMELTSHGMQDKNRADIAMVVDALELAFTHNYIDTFIIVSGDSDFTPLVLKMRELNKYVVGIGTRGSTSRLLVSACDEFIYYDAIIREKQRGQRRSQRLTGFPKQQAKAMDMLMEALDSMLREDPSPPKAQELRSAILRRHSDFNETDLGFPSFTAFLEIARDAGLISLHRDKKGGDTHVDMLMDVEPIEPASPRDLRRSSGGSKRSSSGGRSHSSSGGGGGGRSSSGSRSSSNDQPSPAPKSADAFEDPYLPKGTEKLIDALDAADLSPLSAPVRKAVLEALTTAVTERAAKRRRTTISFVVEDLRRRLRKTFPELTTKNLRDLLTSLMDAKVLIHKDGSPIRTPSAPFNIHKSADQLNRVLCEQYAKALSKASVSTSDTPLLADLFFGDRERTREVEEILAWQAAAPDDEDDLLIADDDGGNGKPAKSAKASKAKPSGSRRSRDDDDDDDLDDLLAADGDDDDDDLDGLLDADGDDDLDDLLAADGDDEAPAKKAKKPAPKKASKPKKPAAKAKEADAPAAKAKAKEPAAAAKAKEPQAPAAKPSAEATDAETKAASSKAESRKRRAAARKKPEAEAKAADAKDAAAPEPAAAKDAEPKPAPPKADDAKAADAPAEDAPKKAPVRRRKKADDAAKDDAPEAPSDDS